MCLPFTRAEFYKYKTKSFDNPLFRLHFQSDAPIDLKALFFVPEMSEVSSPIYSVGGFILFATLLKSLHHYLH